jgi:cytochrome P450
MTTTPEPPGPRGFPLLGVLPALRRDTLTLLERARREHGDVVRFLAGPPGLRTTTYALFHPDAVRRVLAGRADDYRKENRFYTELRLALGDGLLNSQDERWLRQRRFVQPLFTRRRIAGYAAAMGEEAEALAHGWRAAARTGAQIDVHREMSRLTLRVVGRLLFGADVERAVPVVAASFPSSASTRATARTTRRARHGPGRRRPTGEPRTRSGRCARCATRSSPTAAGPATARARTT